MRRLAAAIGAGWSALALGSALPVAPVMAQPGAGPGAHAPTAPSDEARPDAPWAAGIAEEDRARAEELLVRGNEHLVNHRFAAALEVYQLAIRVWDHPAIRANMAVCFINLGKVLEAYESVELALQHGPAPFDKPEVHAATLNYKKLLERQVGFLHVRCTEPDAVITVDGRDLLPCPGQRRFALLPGRHQLIAQKQGFVTITRSVTIRGGDVETMDLRLIRLEHTFRTERLWHPRFPAAVAAGGAGLAFFGVFLRQKAEATMRRYDAHILRRCGDVGCRRWEIPGPVQAIKRRALRLNRTANTVLGVGALATATGLVLRYVNRPRQVPYRDSRLSLWMGTETTLAAGLALSGRF